MIETVVTPGPSGCGVSAVTTSYTYDSLGNILTITSPGNNAATTITRTYSYTVDGSYTQNAMLGKPIKGMDNGGHTWHYRYDTRGNVASFIDGIGNVRDFTYNIANQLVDTAMPSTGQTGTGHRILRNVYQYSGGPKSALRTYDESFMLIRQVNYAYGNEGHIISITGSKEPVSYSYDALYRCISLSDGNSHETQYAYNTAGYLSQIAYPGHTGTGYSDTISFPSYNASGQLLQRVNGNGVTINYTYADAAGALSAISYPSIMSRNATFIYDDYGRLVSKTDGEGVYGYSYDDLNNRVSVISTYTGLPTRAISYTYHKDGSRSSMTTPAGSFIYEYDESGRAAAITNPFAETTTWQYLDNSWISSQTLHNGVVTAYSYNQAAQLTDVLHSVTTSTLSHFTGISYDGVSVTFCL